MQHEDRLTPLYLPAAQLSTWAHLAADAGRKEPATECSAKTSDGSETKK